MAATNFLDIALQYHKAGFRVIPVDGKKTPTCGSWLRFKEAQSEKDVCQIFAKDTYGIAVLTGVNGLECIDIDSKYSLKEGMEVDFMKLVDDFGGVSLLNLTVIQTPSKGWHVLYRCEQPGGNTKLASRHTTAEEKEANPDERVKVLFETRGTGGYICAYPTPGYKVDVGKMSTIPKITMAERAILLNCAKSFNEVINNVELNSAERAAKREFKDGLPSWEDYNAKTDCVYLLERYGWKMISERGDRVYLRRPGKTQGISGDYNKALNLFKAWSTSTPFESEKAYSPYGVYAVMEHNGDWSKAAKELIRAGYGTNGQLVQQQPQRQTVVSISNPDEIAASLAKRRFDYFKKPKDIEFIFKAQVEGQTFDIGGFGMIGIITGLEKSRKTTFLKAIIASFLSDGQEKINFKLNLKGKKAIFVDTEQPDVFFHSTQSHALNMSGIRGNTPIYEAYFFRDLSIEERVSHIDYLIDNNPNLGLLVLDGALDLVRNYNDEAQCMALTQKMLEWTTKSNALLLTVIHKSKGSGFMLGHLGSALARKCDFAIEMNHNLDSGFTTVSSKLGRTKPFISFEFTQDDNGYPILNHNEKAIDQDPAPQASYYEPAEKPTIFEKTNTEETLPF